MKNNLNKIIFFFVIGIVSAILCYGSPVYAADKIILKLAHITAPGGMMDMKAHKFAELVSSKTNGKVKIEIYPAQQLGNIKEILQGISMGTIDMAQENAQFIEAFEKDYAIIGCPFMFSQNEIRGDKFIAELEENIRKKTGIRTLPGVGFRPAMHLFTQKRSILTPSELNNIKLRTWQSKSLVDTWNGLGATAVPLPWGDVYLSLAQGIVNGMPHNIVQVRDEKFYEQLDYCTKLNFMPIFDRTWINDTKFKSLPADIQQALIDSSVESSDWFTSYAVGLEAEAQKQLEKAGMKFSTADRVVWVQKAKSVHIELEKQGLWSKGLLEKLGK